jgi:glycine/D-amino acid oxidase-like deaminating enzyme
VVGKDEAVKIARFEYACMVAVHDFIRDQNISCDSRRCDTVDVIYDQSQWDQAIKAIELMRDVMGEDDPVARYTVWTAKETAEKFLCEGAVGGITYEAGSLSAYKLVVGILKLALEKGLNLQCNTPVTALKRALDGESGAGEWLVQTTRGTVLAKKLIMATNGYTAHLYPQFQGVIIPLRGHVSAHRPGRSMPKNGLQTTYSFVYKMGYEYMVSRPTNPEGAGDLIIGGGSTMVADSGIGEYGNTDDGNINEHIFEYLNGTTAGYFGKNWGEDDPVGRVRAAWSGIMGYSGDELPYVGPVPGENGLFVSASFQGHGMVLCWLCAKALAGVLSEDSAYASDWFPKSFWVTEERMRAKFEGKLHSPRAVERKSMGNDVDEATLPL